MNFYDFLMPNFLHHSHLFCLLLFKYKFNLMKEFNEIIKHAINNFNLKGKNW